MLQREVAPTGESSSVIHVVYLLSICLWELLLQVFVQPHALVLQVLRKFLVQKNWSESVANVHWCQLCSVKILQGGTLNGCEHRPSWDQNSCWLQTQEWPWFSMLPNQMHFLEPPALLCATAFPSLNNQWLLLFPPLWACMLLGCFWSVSAPAYSPSCFLYASS